MGNNSNTQTLRLNLFYNNNTSNTSTCLHNIQFIKTLSRSLFKKQVFLIDFSISNELNTLELTLFVFFRARKITNYKKLSLKSDLKKTNFYNLQGFNILKNKKLIKTKLKFVVLNKIKSLRYQNKRLLITFYKKFRSFKLKLFNKNFNLFFDFIKISLLFLIKKTNLKIILQLLSLIFCTLQKRAHSAFLFFLKTYFTLLLKIQDGVFKGLKFLIFGKISGKTRSTFKRIQVGSVSVQSIRDNIDYSKLHVYTRYGTFGFKLWASFFKL